MHHRDPVGEVSNSNLARAYYNRGNAYSTKGQFERAIQDYDQAIESRPERRRLLRAQPRSGKEGRQERRKAEWLPWYRARNQVQGRDTSEQIVIEIVHRRSRTATSRSWSSTPSTNPQTVGYCNVSGCVGEGSREAVDLCPAGRAL